MGGRLAGSAGEGSAAARPTASPMTASGRSARSAPREPASERRLAADPPPSPWTVGAIDGPAPSACRPGDMLSPATDRDIPTDPCRPSMGERPRVTASRRIRGTSVAFSSGMTSLAASLVSGPAFERLPSALRSSSFGQLWGVVLAGGEGIRLRPLTRLICGDERPKQYVALTGSRSLLRQTLDRWARRAFRPSARSSSAPRLTPAPRYIGRSPSRGAIPRFSPSPGQPRSRAPPASPSACSRARRIRIAG